MKEVQNDPEGTDQAELNEHAWKLMMLKQQIKKPNTNWFLPCIIAALLCILGIGQAISFNQMDHLLVILPFLGAIGVLVSIESRITKKRFETLLELLDLENETNTRRGK